MTDVTHTKLTELLSYDPLTGSFIWKISPSKTVKANDIAGCPDRKGYICIAISGRYYKAHRLAWFTVYRVWPKGRLDHKDGVKANNRIDNLREASSAQNAANSKVYSTNTSGYKGAYFLKKTGKWRSAITDTGKVRHLGIFNTPQEAHEAYWVEAQRIHGTFARKT